MNIYGVTASYRSKCYERTRSEKASVSKKETDVKKEKVEISHKSEELQFLKGLIGEFPEVRLEVVEEIQARIKNNDYPIENSLDEALKKIIQSNILDS